jgi:hypothetical protein
MKKTLYEKLVVAVISVFCVVFSIFMIPHDLHDNLFRGPSGGAYPPTFWDRAYGLILMVGGDVWVAFISTRGIARWFKRKRNQADDKE